MILEKNTFHFIVGQNGAGKTTLFDILAGLIDAEGEILNAFSQKEILYITQAAITMPNATGKEVAKLYLGADGEKEKAELKQLKRSLDEFSAEKLEHLWETELGKFSGGEFRWFIVFLMVRMNRELYLMNRLQA